MHRKASWLWMGLVALAAFGVACGQCDKDEAVDGGVAGLAAGPGAVDAGRVAQVETTPPVPKAKPDAGGRMSAATVGVCVLCSSPGSSSKASSS